MTQKEKAYHDILMKLHLFRWTMDYKKMGAVMDAIAAYSYHHTNSNGYDDEPTHEELFTQLVKRVEEI